MKNCVACFLGLLAALCIAGAVGARAQTTTAQVSGQVTDSTGAAVPQASITITNVNTSLSRKAETSGTGFYVITLLQPGNYTLTVEKQGFQTAAFPNLILQVNETLALDAVLQVGAITQSVTVEAQAPLLQATSANLGEVVTDKAVVELPLNGRNFTQLLNLTPGVTPLSTGQYANVGGGFGGAAGIPGTAFSQPSVGGQWNRANMYLMDGINFTSWFTGEYTVLPVLDGIQEFKVQQHNDSAEYGGAPGGIINVATKSGTNQIHGSGWEFVRNNIFDARDAFADAQLSSPPPFRQNQFGASVGGPVVIPKVYNGKNRTWFFFAYEGWRYRHPAQAYDRIPTPAELSGDFSADYTTQRLFDPATSAANPAEPGGFIRLPFVCVGPTAVAQGTAGATPCNKIPGSELNPMTVGEMTALYPTPNIVGIPSYNYLYNGEDSNNDNTYLFKIDQRISERDNAWFRWTKMYMPIISPEYPAVSSGTHDTPNNYGGGETHVFSPNLIFDGRFGRNSYPENAFTGPNAGNGIFTQLGYKGTARYGYVDNELTAPYSGIGNSGPFEEHQDDWDVSGTMTWVHGHHTIKGGFQFFFLRYQCCALQPGMGQRDQYSFTNTQTGDPTNLANTGDSLASAILGYPDSIYFAAQKFNFWFPSWAPFIEDKWQVTPRLSVTLGLRYDHTSTPHLIVSDDATLDPGNGDWLIGGGKLPPACNVTNAAPCIPGDGNLANIPYGNKIVVAPNPDIGPQSVNNMWGPRLGIAWRPTEKTVVRAGYGIVYGSMMGQIQSFQANVGQWPDAVDTELSFNPTGGALTTVQQLQTLSASALPTASPWTSENWMVDPHVKPMRSYQWNIGVQREMSHNLMLSISYAGASSDRLNENGLFNVATAPTNGNAATIKSLTPFPWSGTTFMNESIGLAHYNGLLLSAEKRYASGLQFMISYTWSKAMDDGGSGYYTSENGPGGDSAVQNFYNIKGDWGLSAYDITNYMSAAIMYELPWGKGRRFLNTGGPLSAIFGGWQVNTITTARSGQIYNLDVEGDVANLGNQVGWFNYARPNLVGNPHLSHPTAQEWFNTSAFSIPVNSFGNFGKDVLRSQAVYNVDFSLFRTIHIKERLQMEIRGEAFNVLNHFMLGTPGVDIGTSDAGVILGDTGPRIIQLGMKLRF